MTSIPKPKELEVQPAEPENRSTATPAREIPTDRPDEPRSEMESTAEPQPTAEPAIKPQPEPQLDLPAGERRWTLVEVTDEMAAANESRRLAKKMGKQRKHTGGERGESQPTPRELPNEGRETEVSKTIEDAIEARAKLPRRELPTDRPDEPRTQQRQNNPEPQPMSEVTEADTGANERPEVESTTEKRARIVCGPFLNHILDQTAKELIRCADRTHLFRQGNEYVRVLDGDLPTIEIATPEVMVSEIDRVAYFVRIVKTAKGEEERITEPPKEIPGRLLKIRRWPLRRLEGISSIPVIRDDGSIATSKGYDRASKYFLSVARKYPSVRECQTQEDARAACKALLVPFTEYPWVSSADPSVFLSLILSFVGRPLINGPVPMYAITATVRGTGKTMLGKAACLIGTGREPPMQPRPKDSDEMKKLLTSIVISGEPTLFLDNLRGHLDDPNLEAFTTATEWTDRVLGLSRKMTGKVKAITIATGNGLSFAGDLGRRVLTVGLDAKTENAEDRTFECSDLLSEIRHEQPRLTTHALTVLRAFILAGSPNHDRTLFGSCESWDRLVRSALVWAGQPDPNDVRARIREEDDVDTENLRQLMGAWWGAFGSAAQTVSNVADYATRQSEAGKDLRGSLLNYAATRAGDVDQKRLAYALRSLRGRVCKVEGHDLRLEKDGASHGNITRWRLAEGER